MALGGVLPTKYPIKVCYSNQSQVASNSCKGRIISGLPHERPLGQTFTGICSEAVPWQSEVLACTLETIGSPLAGAMIIKPKDSYSECGWTSGAWRRQAQTKSLT